MTPRTARRRLQRAAGNWAHCTLRNHIVVIPNTARIAAENGQTVSFLNNVNVAHSVTFGVDHHFAINALTQIVVGFVLYETDLLAIDSVNEFGRNVLLE